MTFVIPGVPVPKARPRVMRGGWTFTPKKTRDAENLVRLTATMARQATKELILGSQFNGRVFVRTVFFGARKNADLDNLYKTVTDALQGTLYANDSQIDQAEIVRMICQKGKERTEVAIEEILNA